MFVLEIERALLERRVDLAVHSLKDLPTAQPEGLRVVVAGEREDVRDALVWNVSVAAPEQTVRVFSAALDGLPLRIGTCSLRRAAQIRALMPNTEILPLRGNVDTRLRRLDAGNYDAIVLAAAGLHRLGMQERLAGRVTYLPMEQVLPAPGQGALALEIRDEPDMRALVKPLRDPVTEAATTAERAFMRRLGAGCYLPVAAYAQVRDGRLHADGLVISLDGKECVRVSQGIPWAWQTSLEQAESLGAQLAEQALLEGANRIIQSLAHEQEREHV